MHLVRQPLNHLVEEHFVRSATLYEHGVWFYQHGQVPLVDICQAYGLKLPALSRKIAFSRELVAANLRAEAQRFEQLQAQPLEQVIGHLQQAHRQFIRVRLPYMRKLIADLPEEAFDDPALARDLKFVFPLFVEDFVAHIHEEEDQLFGHLSQLLRALHEEGRPSRRLCEAMGRYALADVQAHHAEEDDDMRGLRELTGGYAVHAQTGLFTRVVFSVLQEFEGELQRHARLENEVLFPKACRLEQHVKGRMSLWR